MLIINPPSLIGIDLSACNNTEHKYRGLRWIKLQIRFSVLYHSPNEPQFKRALSASLCAISVCFQKHIGGSSGGAYFDVFVPNEWRVLTRSFVVYFRTRGHPVVVNVWDGKYWKRWRPTLSWWIFDHFRVTGCKYPHMPKTRIPKTHMPKMHIPITPESANPVEEVGYVEREIVSLLRGIVEFPHLTFPPLSRNRQSVNVRHWGSFFLYNRITYTQYSP